MVQQAYDLNQRINSINEQLYNCESAYNACCTYIEHVNEQICYNEQLYAYGQITKRMYDSNKNKFKNERSRLVTQSKDYYKKAYKLRETLNKIYNSMENY